MNNYNHYLTGQRAYDNQLPEDHFSAMDMKLSGDLIIIDGKYYQINYEIGDEGTKKYITGFDAWNDSTFEFEPVFFWEVYELLVNDTKAKKEFDDKEFYMKMEDVLK